MDSGSTLRKVLLGLVPLVLLGGVVYLLFTVGATSFRTGLPEVEDLRVLRHRLEPDRIILDVLNAGTGQSTIAQLQVRGAFWYHEVHPKRDLKPLETARVEIPFPWNLGEPVNIVLLSSTGLTFPYEIAVAAETPKATPAAFGRFALLGAYVGVIPVGLGICWFPFLRRLGRKALGFLLSLTVGLLAFLVIDALDEGLEVARELPGVYRGTALLALGTFGAFFSLFGIEVRARDKRGASITGGTLAWLIALGIGLHNLGEGLAIGSAYVLGEVTLGALLIVGFAIHNATEGIAIVVPTLDEGARVLRLVGLGALAGLPTILGCWLGAFTISKVWALLFLGVGAGAIVQVIGAIVGRRSLSETFSPWNLLGLGAGYGLMYGTGLLVGG